MWGRGRHLIVILGSIFFYVKRTSARIDFLRTPSYVLGWLARPGGRKTFAVVNVTLEMHCTITQKARRQHNGPQDLAPSNETKVRTNNKNTPRCALISECSAAIKKEKITFIASWYN